MCALYLLIPDFGELDAVAIPQDILFKSIQGLTKGLYVSFNPRLEWRFCRHNIRASDIVDVVGAKKVCARKLGY